MPGCGRWLYPTLDQLEEETYEIYLEVLDLKLKKYPKILRGLLKRVIIFHKRREIKKMAREAIKHTPYAFRFLKHHVLYDLS